MKAEDNNCLRALTVERMPTLNVFSHDALRRRCRSSVAISDGESQCRSLGGRGVEPNYKTLAFHNSTP
jgi:hypothetical protein